MKSGTHSFNASFVSAPRSTTPSESIWIRLGAASTKSISWIVDYFSGQTAPRIQQKRDRAGSYFFHVVDPINQQTYRFESEAEVRTWLENRYSQ